MEQLPVIFRAERAGEFAGTVTAVFPTLPDDYLGQKFTVYATIGQHGGACLDWYKATRPARPDEFADLLQELRQIYESAPAACPDIYGPPVELTTRRRISGAMNATRQAAARAARDSLRADPSGGPWSPAARDATAAAMAADIEES